MLRARTLLGVLVVLALVGAACTDEDAPAAASAAPSETPNASPSVPVPPPTPTPAPVTQPVRLWLTLGEFTGPAAGSAR